MGQAIHDSSPTTWTIILGPGLNGSAFPDEQEQDERDLALAGALEHAYALSGHLRTVVVQPEEAASRRPASDGARALPAPRMPMAALRRPAKVLSSTESSSGRNLLRALSHVHEFSHTAIVFVIDLDVHRGELPSPLLSSAVIDQAATWQRLVVVGSPATGGDMALEHGWIVPGQQAGFLSTVVRLYPTGLRPPLANRLGGHGSDSLAYSGLVGGTLFAWARVFTRLRRDAEDRRPALPAASGGPDLFRDVLIPGFDNLMVARSPQRENAWPTGGASERSPAFSSGLWTMRG
jgi:hypothetical protein